MKSGWTLALGVLLGLFSAGVIYLASTPPRGQPVTLLPPPTPGPLAIHVTGAVAQPGVYHLPAGSRVEDAIRAAGGCLPEANPQSLNLATVLKDGARLTIPAMSQNPPAGEQAAVSSSQAPSTGLININTASLSELETLPGIGPAIGGRIIAYREENGAFHSIDDIQNVSGIGPVIFSRLKDLITVDD